MNLPRNLEPHKEALEEEAKRKLQGLFFAVSDIIGRTYQIPGVLPMIIEASQNIPDGAEPYFEDRVAQTYTALISKVDKEEITAFMQAAISYNQEKTDSNEERVQSVLRGAIYKLRPEGMVITKETCKETAIIHDAIQYQIEHCIDEMIGFLKKKQVQSTGNELT